MYTNSNRSSLIRPGMFSRITFEPTGENEEVVVPPVTDPDPNDPPQDPPTGTVTPPAPATVSMPSDELKKRIARASESGISTLLKELGFKDKDAAKAAIAKLTELEQAQMTENEKLQEKLRVAETAAEEARKTAETVENARKADKRETALMKALKENGVADAYTELALPLIDKHVKATFGDDADLSTVDFKTYFAELKTTKPGLFEAAAKPANDTAPKPTAPTPKPNSAVVAKKTTEMTDAEYKVYKQSKGRQ